MNDFSEHLLCRLPVTIRRKVRWGDCDPAGVVYTPVFSHYAMSAFNWFMDVLLEGPLQERSQALGFATPFKALNFEFHNPLWPDQIFDMICLVSDVRRRTFDIELKAVDLTRKSLFTAKMTPIFIARDERRSI